MSFGALVGLKFREAMSGYLASGESDPAAGEQRGRGQPDNFTFVLDVEIPGLRDFLDSPVHQADVVGGNVVWEGHAREGTPIAGGGSIVMYRNITPDGRQKVFDFVFSFQGDDGTWVTITGQKRLSDDRGFDAGADLSTLYVQATAAGPPVAAGVTRVHVDELLDQIASLQVTGAVSEPERAAARAAFLTFINAQLSQVYPHLPFLFRVDEDRYLTSAEWRALSLVVSVMLPNPLPASGPSIQDTVENLQNFIRSADPQALESIRQWLRIAGIIAPLAQGFLPAIRQVIQQTLESDAAGTPRTVCELLHRVAVLPYFSHPKADALVDYHRPRFTPAHNTQLPIKRLPSPRTFDVAIVGAGVAGSLLAERLTAKGKSVLILESGPYLAERDITPDELTMTARLFKASGLQSVNDDELAASSGSFVVLQGACVGGGGTVNNAICFQLPEARLAAWQRNGFPIQTADMRQAYAATAQDLDIKPVSEATSFFNPMGQLLHGLGPVRKPRVDEPPAQGLYECLVNLSGGDHPCEGLGLCNSGCGSERKRNALQVYLPRALARDCELVPNARVVDIKLVRDQPQGAPRAGALIVDVSGHIVEVQAQEVVLCAGAIGSSVLLLTASDVRQEIERRGLPVGRRFCANVGSPLFAFFNRTIHPRPSLQISHYYMPPDGAGFVIETWFAPPGTLALAMPGYFETHWERMLAYSRAVTAAPLVGTEPQGTITVNADRRVQIQLPLGQVELERLRTGTIKLAEALLQAGDPDLIEVVAGTRLGFSIKSDADVRRFEQTLTAPAQLRLGTGHPQGGNAMSLDPDHSVVDEQFQVRGIANLRVCDASVFPEVAGVNPQWTVMALAHHCARLMTT